MTLQRVTLDPAYDPLNPAASTQEPAQACSCVGVVLPASQGTIEAFDNRILDDPAALKKFRFVILAGKGLTFTPEPNDFLLTTEGAYRLLGATPLNPDGGGAIIYNVGCTFEEAE